MWRVENLLRQELFDDEPLPPPRKIPGYVPGLDYIFDPTRSLTITFDLLCEVGKSVLVDVTSVFLKILVLRFSASQFRSRTY